jgi:hypothetical protein
MVYAVRGGEFCITKTSMLINPLIFHGNVGRIDLRTPQGVSATEITGQVAVRCPPASPCVDVTEWPKPLNNKA